jgi:hypothetical protein
VSSSDTYFFSAANLITRCFFRPISSEPRKDKNSARMAPADVPRDGGTPIFLANHLLLAVMRTHSDQHLSGRLLTRMLIAHLLLPAFLEQLLLSA